MTLRAVVVWCVILCGAIINGFARQAWILPRTGERLGYALSTIGLSVIVAFAALLTIDWIGPATRQDAWRLGVLWLLLTLSFEFLAGHFLFGQPWSRLVADYNLADGRIWILVLVVTALAPLGAAYLRGLLR